MGMDLQLGPGVSHPRRPIHQLHVYQSHSSPLAKPQLSWPMMYRTGGGRRAGVCGRILIRLHIMHCFVLQKKKEREVINALSPYLAPATYLVCLKRYLLNSTQALRSRIMITVHLDKLHSDYPFVKTWTQLEVGGCSISSAFPHKPVLRAPNVNAWRHRQRHLRNSMQIVHFMRWKRTHENRTEDTCYTLTWKQALFSDQMMLNM